MHSGRNIRIFAVSRSLPLEAYRTYYLHVIDQTSLDIAKCPILLEKESNITPI